MDDHADNNETIVDNYRKIIDFDLVSYTKESLEKLSKNHYHVIISDMNREQNETEGIDFLEEIKLQQIQHPPPVILSVVNITHINKGNKLCQRVQL